jgi:glutamyl-tRNA synthetase
LHALFDCGTIRHGNSIKLEEIFVSKIRTRFAPSPTGRMHVGNLRTALYAYLIAKHEEGDFILRIEDTDQERLVEGAVDIIYRTLEKTGLLHDEGPDMDKGVGPYVQSERQASGMYLEYAKKLVEKGEAYYCFCDKERLASLTRVVEGKEINSYDKHCLSLSKEEVQEKLASGMPYVIRQNNPTEGKTTFEDEIYGEISVDNSELDDMVLIKSDGYPTYNFANVVDDHLMGITHVVRGNEYLSSSPKYNRLYAAFGWDVPVYVHCPLITDENHKKLSKRSGHSSYEDLIEQGFLTEAIVNFVSLLGWSPEDNQEIFTLEELVKVFNYRNMSKSPAVFDYQKLRWMNGEYIKAMPFDTYYELALPQIKAVISKDLNFEKIATMTKTRIEVFPDIREHIDFFEEVPEYSVEMYTHKKMKTNAENSLALLEGIIPVIEAQESFTNDDLFMTLKDYAKEHEYKVGFLMWPIRTALSGKQMTPAGATEILEVLGKEESLIRLKQGIEKLKNEA